MLLGLPLSGVYGAGRELGHYLHFPPLTFTVKMSHAPFSWPVFAMLSVLIVFSILPLDRVVFKNRRKAAKTSGAVLPFPWWGWAGAGFLTLAWVFAWSRFDVFKPVQIFSFSPLWVGYIVVVNALTERRGKPCMLRTRPLFTVGLAGLSLVFWWFFEYLNRFAQNWYYTGIGELSPLTYFLYASLPFATVLPAVAGTCDYLKTFPIIGAGLDDFVRLHPRPLTARVMAWGVLFLCCTALAGIGAFPDLFFFALWVAPLGLIVSVQVLCGRKTVFSNLASGQWRTLYCYVLAALVCGVFWEMWNMGSLAQWHYAIPFVERFRVFEMPYLGYAGYLPFGIECYVAVDILERMAFGDGEDRETMV